jgi:hypothetical protein
MSRKVKSRTQFDLIFVKFQYFLLTSKIFDEVSAEGRKRSDYYLFN